MQHWALSANPQSQVSYSVWLGVNYSTLLQIVFLPSWCLFLAAEKRSFAVSVNLEYSLSSYVTRFIACCYKFFVSKLFALAIAAFCFFLVEYGVKGHEFETRNKYTFDILYIAYCFGFLSVHITNKLLLCTNSSAHNWTLQVSLNVQVLLIEKLVWKIAFLNVLLWIQVIVTASN